MITVTISINGTALYTRSARNMGEKNDKGETKYEVDDGTVIWHKRDYGAIVLAKEMLDTVKDLN